SVIPLWLETVRGCAIDAWVEVCPIAESLPKLKCSIIARFFPTDACEAPINAAITEYLDRTFTIMIPLYILGEVKVEGLILDVDHYYHIPTECDIEVLDTAKLIVLVISDFE
ncbi:uncharacterized protein P174DRAFT_379334, partial [Aspergillus novofumigatus IBT 16806]